MSSKFFGRSVNARSNAEISRDLFLTMNTIKTHIRSLYGTIGVTTRSEAIIWGVRRGLLEGFPALGDTNADDDVPA